MGLISRVSSRTYRFPLFLKKKSKKPPHKKMAEPKQRNLRVLTLRGKSKEELEGELTKYREELANLRVAKVTSGGQAKVCKIKSVRKNIAKVLTVINQAQRSEMQKLFRGKKCKPNALKPRKTRALRRQLNKAEAGAKRLKTVRREQRLAPLKF